MNIGDNIKWKTSRGWSTEGKIVEIEDFKVRVEANDISFKAPISSKNPKQNYTRPKYWISPKKIIEINGVKVSEEKPGS